MSNMGIIDRFNERITCDRGKKYRIAVSLPIPYLVINQCFQYLFHSPDEFNRNEPKKNRVVGIWLACAFGPRYCVKPAIGHITPNCWQIQICKGKNRWWICRDISPGYSSMKYIGMKNLCECEMQSTKMGQLIFAQHFTHHIHLINVVDFSVEFKLHSASRGRNQGKHK